MGDLETVRVNGCVVAIVEGLIEYDVLTVPERVYGCVVAIGL